MLKFDILKCCLFIKTKDSVKFYEISFNSVCQDFLLINQKPKEKGENHDQVAASSGRGCP